VDGGAPTDVTLTDGAATFDLPGGLPQGGHSITATYDTNSTFVGSTSDSTTFTVNPRADTSTTVTAPATAIAGDAVTFTAMVTSSGSTVTGGTVTFQENGVPLGAAQPVNAGGVATFSTVLSAGGHTVTAVYSGDTTFNPSTSQQPATVTVKTATSTSLSASAPGVAFAQPVTLTAKVTSGSGTPPGSVTFLDGGAPLGTLPVDGSGVAGVTVTLGPGGHSLTAVYSGSGTFAGSSSAPVGVSVAPPLAGDVTAVVNVSQTPGPGSKTARTVTLTLVNGSGQEIAGPLVVVLNGLKPTVRVSGTSGFTGSKKHRVPFVVLNPAGGLFPPGGQLSVALKFRGRGVRFTTTVKAGSGTP
jgi:hypothetical protein